jgi:hypothetical protein
MRSRSSLASLAAVLASLAFLASGCGGEDVDIAQDLRVTDVTTGWFDAGIVEEGKNKLVPSISFRLQNSHDSTVTSVQVIAKFSRVGETDEWGSGPFVRAVGPEGLEAGQTTDAIVLRSNLGYTGEEPRAQMLRNSNFIDARIELFAKHHADNWVKLGEYQVERQLLTR